MLIRNSISRSFSVLFQSLKVKKKKYVANVQRSFFVFLYFFEVNKRGGKERRRGLGRGGKSERRSEVIR